MDEVKFFRRTNNFSNYICFIKKEPRTNDSNIISFLKDSKNNLYEVCSYYEWNNDKHFELFIFKINNSNSFISDRKRVYLGEGSQVYIFVDYPYLFSLREKTIGEWSIDLFNVADFKNSHHKCSPEHSFRFNDFVLFMKDPYRNDRYLFIYQVDLDDKNTQTVISSIDATLEGLKHIIPGKCLSFDFHKNILYMIIKNKSYQLVIFNIDVFKEIDRIILDVSKNTEDIWLKIDKENIWLIATVRKSLTSKITEVIKLDKHTYRIVDKFRIDYEPIPNIVIYQGRLIGTFSDNSKWLIIEVDLESKHQKCISILDDDFKYQLLFMKVNESILINDRFWSEHSQLSILSNKDEWIVTNYPSMRIKLKPSTEVVIIDKVDVNETYSFVSLTDDKTIFTDSSGLYIADFNRKEIIPYELMIKDKKDIDYGIMIGQDIFLLVSYNKYFLLKGSVFY